jgi:hypothetical protein
VVGQDSRLVMQGDGNIVMYNSNNDVHWASNVKE